MATTTERLIRAAGLSAIAAGAIFIGVQINHPQLDLDFVGTTEYTVRHAAKMLMTAFALVGIAGTYLRQARQVGLLGLVGYVLFSVGFLAMFGVETIATFVLPEIAKTSPGFVQDVFTAATGSSPTGDIGAMQVLLNLSGAGYILGGLLFGIALFRAGIVARWASALLAVATVGTAALAALPEAFNRPMAVPVGVALIGLGWSSWRMQQHIPAAVTVEPRRVTEPALR